MRRLLVLGSVAIFLLLPSPGLCLMFENYTNANIVNKAILVDGPFVWAGTEGGLVRWSPASGSNEKFTTASGLVHNQVLCLAAANQEGLWVGTIGGASMYSNGVWITLDSAMGLAGSRVDSIQVATNDLVWFGTTGGVTSFDGTDLVTYTTADGLASNWVKDIAEFGGSLYFATDVGVCVFDGADWGLFDTSDGLPSNSISCLTSTTGLLFAGTRGAGICSFDGASWQTYAAVDGVEGSVISSLSTDAHGNVWAATELGISLCTSGNWMSFDTSDGLPDDQLLSVAADEAGNVFVGTARSGIWCWYEGSVIVLALHEGVIDNSVRCVARTSDDSVWFGCETGASVRTGDLWNSHSHAGTKPLGTVNAISEDSNGAIWLGTDSSGLVRFDGVEWTIYDVESGLCDNSVRSLAMMGDLILAGTAKGVSIFDGQSFTSFRNEDGLGFDSVDALAVGPSAEVLLGSHVSGGGLLVFDGEALKHYTTADGLPSNSIYSICAEQEGVVWLGTDMGAVRWDDQGMRTFDKGNGLAGFVVKAITIGPHDDVWLGATGGLSRFDGDSFFSFTQSDGLVDNRVCGLCIGADEDVWVATLGGVTRVHLPKFERPVITAFTSSPTYTYGEDAVCSISLYNPGPSISLDVYSGLITNTEAAYCFTGERWLEQGTVRPWASGITIPSGADLTVSPFVTVAIPSYSPPVSEPGQYFFVAGIADSTTTQIIGDLSFARFELQ